MHNEEARRLCLVVCQSNESPSTSPGLCLQFNNRCMHTATCIIYQYCFHSHRFWPAIKIALPSTAGCNVRSSYTAGHGHLYALNGERRTMLYVCSLSFRTSIQPCMLLITQVLVTPFVGQPIRELLWGKTISVCYYAQDWRQQVLFPGSPSHVCKKISYRERQEAGRWLGNQAKLLHCLHMYYNLLSVA